MITTLIKSQERDIQHDYIVVLLNYNQVTVCIYNYR